MHQHCLFTYKRDAGSQQQDSDKQVFKLLNNQLPDALAWRRQSQIDGSAAQPLHGAAEGTSQPQILLHVLQIPELEPG